MSPKSLHFLEAFMVKTWFLGRQNLVFFFNGFVGLWYVVEGCAPVGKCEVTYISVNYCEFENKMMCSFEGANFCQKNANDIL